MSKTSKMIILSVLGGAVIVGTMMVGGIGFSYDVIYDGEKVGRISDLTVYGEAKSIAEQAVVSDGNGAVSLSEPKLYFTFSFEAPSTSAEELSTSIISHSAEVVKGYSVEIEGIGRLYVADKDDFIGAVSDYCEKFEIEGTDAVNTVKNKVTYSVAYFDNGVIASEESLGDIVSRLEITTVVNKKTTYEVPYKTETTRTAKKYQGYMSVTTAGVKGVNEKLEKVTYVNGVQVSSEVISDTVITAPVNEQVLVGTAVKTASTTTVIHNTSTKGFIWPLAVKGVITSYWGDGREHKGLDIAAPKGTDTYAVKDGTVVDARYASDYGWFVTIDHGNGVQTRYAHHSKLYVKKGDVVKQGQVIAAVGTTGNSTGNHCHFEVIINGTRVNPAPYLGI